MQDDNGELQELHPGDVAFPPQVGLHAGPHGGQEVVAVHDHVYEGVDQAEQGVVATWETKEAVRPETQVDSVKFCHCLVVQSLE